MDDVGHKMREDYNRNMGWDSDDGTSPFGSQESKHDSDIHPGL
jgi:hypothetical protein